MDQNGKSLGKIPHLPKPTTTGRPHLNSSRTSSVVAPGRLNAASWRLGSKVFPRASVKRSGHMPHDWTNGKILRSASCKVFGSITLGFLGGRPFVYHLLPMAQLNLGMQDPGNPGLNSLEAQRFQPAKAGGRRSHVFQVGMES